MRSKRWASPAATPLTDNLRRKRRRTNYVIVSSDEEVQSEDDSEELGEDEWEINCILDETDSQYLIDWVGDYTPTWEPKENANEVAKQAWEEKKRTGSSQKETTPVQPPPAQPHPAIPGEPSAGSPDLDARPLQPSSSPLFVPLDLVADSLGLPEIGEFSQLNPSPNKEKRSRLYTSTTSARIPRKIEDEIRLSPRVFEYTPTISIPPEYQLVGESDLPIYYSPPRTQNHGAASLDSGSLSLDGSGSGIVQNTRETRQAVAGGTRKEIPETPPVPVSTPERRKFPVHSRSQQTFQTTTVPDSVLSSTPTSRINLLGDPSSLGKSITATADSVPESVHLYPTQASTSGRSISGVTMEDQNERKEVESLAETMERYSHLPGSTPREKLRNAYAKLREKGPTEVLQNDPSATPSSVGDIEPSAPVSVPETVAPLSVRIDKEPSHNASGDIAPAAEPSTELPLASTELEEPIQTIQPSALTVNNMEHVSPGSIHLGPSEFAIPLPMDSRVRDDYKRMLTTETQSISEYLDNLDGTQIPDNEENFLPKMQEVLERLSNVATHPDLNITQHIRASEPDLGKEASWAEYSSAKFLLLGYLVDAASTHDKHLVITVRGERSQQVVERFFMGKGLSYTRPRDEMGAGTNVEVSMVKGSLSFGIQSAGSDGVVETYKPPSAILALDSSLNTKSPSVQHMRTTYARNGHLLPVIWLIVANSSEHIELCFPGSTTPQRLLLLLRYCHRLQEMVGDLQDDALGVQEDADELWSCLLSDNFNANWTLPLVEPLRNVIPSELLQNEPQNESNNTHSPAPSNPAIQKRLFTDDGGEQVSKRPRMEPSQDASQLTELTKGPSQTLDNDLQALENNLVQMQNSHAAALEKLQKTLVATQSRLQEREKILDSLQHRYETRTNDLHKIRKERDHLTESKITSNQKLEKQKEDISKLKDERTQLKHDLEQARGELKNGGGDMAALESAREEIRRLTKENASLERKAEYERKQAEYTREQYQTASNVAAQSGNEIRQLREENESLKRKVEGDASRLRELNIKNDENRHLARVKELELILATREDLLRRKEDELREIRKNRPSTRSTSTQPRSPKWTAANSRPTSPGFNNGSNFPGRGSALRFSSEMPL